ncbi:MAG TPA: PAS domain-containing protein, partial [Petrotogaceae bacterium]|nr:PAS domain-containing protein [Petrotogaceae bacterium]
VRLCEKNCPASRAMQDGLPKRAEIFLHHKNGYRIPVVATVYPVKNYDGVVSGVIEVFNDLSEKDRQSQSLVYDELTGILCKQEVEQKIKQAEEDFKKVSVPFGLICFGIDNLSQIAEKYKERVAEKILIMAAKNLSANLRITDETGRWDNDSFMLIVKFVDREQLHDIAQNMLITMNNCFLKEENEIIMASVSAGGSVFKDNDSIYTITERAVHNLEKARLTDKGSLFID